MAKRSYHLPRSYLLTVAFHFSCMTSFLHSHLEWFFHHVLPNDASILENSPNGLPLWQNCPQISSPEFRRVTFQNLLCSFSSYFIQPQPGLQCTMLYLHIHRISPLSSMALRFTLWQVKQIRCFRTGEYFKLRFFFLYSRTYFYISIS